MDNDIVMTDGGTVVCGVQCDNIYCHTAHAKCQQSSQPAHIQGGPKVSVITSSNTDYQYLQNSFISPFYDKAKNLNLKKLLLQTKGQNCIQQLERTGLTHLDIQVNQLNQF